jgi:transposase
MEQRAGGRFLLLKALNPPLIHSEPESIYHQHALALPTVCKWLARFRDGRTELSDDSRSGRPRKSDLAGPISSMLKERPFSSCKLLARHFRVTKATCLRILREDLELKRFHLRWVAHTLDSTYKRNRVALSHELLDILRPEQECSSAHVMTGDEWWFFQHYPNESACLESQDELPARVKQTIDTEKCRISVLWSVNGIHWFVDVPKWESYHSAFFCNVVVPSLVGIICSYSRQSSLKDLYVHLDNARPHNSSQSNNSLQATKARRMAQPDYIPDLAPSDFFLFGFLKQ